MTRGLAVVFLLCCVAVPTGRASSQAAPPPAQTGSQTPQQGPTFRTRIDSVSVDVIVTDRKGQPVTDLTADDFEIRESGKPQTIDTFKFIDVEASQASRPTTHREILSLEDQRREAGRDDTRVLVIYLDDYHVRLGNSMRVREQIAAFVSQLAPNDMVAVMYPLTPASALTFSRNHDGTAAAIMQFMGRKYDYTPKNAYEERYQFQPPEVHEKMRNDTVMSSLESLVTYMGALREGRKSVLFVSEGLSGSMPPGVTTRGTMPPPVARGGTNRQQESELEQRLAFFASTEILSRMRFVFSAAARANTAVYTLDPRGLATSEFDINDNVGSEADRRVMNEAMDMLRTLADETDGRAIVNRNNALPELAQMVRDTSAYYLLGYTSTEAPRDGKFHQIQVRVKRPDIEVRARKGYWAYTAEEAERASAPPRPEPPRDVLEALETLANADETTLRRRGLNLWVGAQPAAGGAEVTLAWEGASERGGDPTTTVDRIEAVVTTQTGDAVFQAVVPKSDPLGRRSGRASFAAPPGSLRLRVTGQNEAGERVEAIDEVFDVPDFASGALAVTAPAVYRGRTARDIQTIRAAEAPVPAVTRAFSRTERLLLRFGVQSAPGTAPTVALRLLNRTGEQVAPLPAATSVGPGRYEAQVVLAGLPPGDYIVEVGATSGDQAVRTLLALRVTG